MKREFVLCFEEAIVTFQTSSSVQINHLRNDRRSPNSFSHLSRRYFPPSNRIIWVQSTYTYFDHYFIYLLNTCTRKNFLTHDKLREINFG